MDKNAIYLFQRGHTSRKVCSCSFCSSSYSYVGFITVPGVGLKKSLVVELIVEVVGRRLGFEGDCGTLELGKERQASGSPHRQPRGLLRAHGIVVVLRDWFDKQNLTRTGPG